MRSIHQTAKSIPNHLTDSLSRWRRFETIPDSTEIVAGNGGATPDKIGFKPVATAGRIRRFRPRKAVCLDHTEETVGLGPVPSSAVPARERIEERERNCRGERENRRERETRVRREKEIDDSDWPTWLY